MKMYTLIFKAAHYSIPSEEKIGGWALWGWGCKDHELYRDCLFTSKEALEEYCVARIDTWTTGEYVILELGDVTYEEE